MEDNIKIFADLVLKKRELDAVIESMKPEVVKFLAENGGACVVEGAFVHLSERKNYQFNDDIVKLEEELKRKKEEAIKAKNYKSVEVTVFPVVRKQV